LSCNNNENTRCSNDLLDAHRADAIAEDPTIGCIPVPHQILRRRIARKGLGHLAREPGLCGILGDIEVNDLSAVVAEDDKAWRSRNVAVATTKISSATMSRMWLCRKARQVGEGTLGRRSMHLPTVAFADLDYTEFLQRFMRQRPSGSPAVQPVWGRGTAGIPALRRRGS
jgi:hypothetical protein